MGENKSRIYTYSFNCELSPDTKATIDYFMSQYGGKYVPPVREFGDGFVDRIKEACDDEIIKTFRAEFKSDKLDIRKPEKFFYGMVFRICQENRFRVKETRELTQKGFCKYLGFDHRYLNGFLTKIDRALDQEQSTTRKLYEKVERIVLKNIR